MQDFSLKGFHGLGFAEVLMIVAEQMQHTVHHQMGQVVDRMFSLLAGLSDDSFPGQDYVAEQTRTSGHCFRGFIQFSKGKYVGRFVPAAVVAVEALDETVV